MRTVRCEAQDLEETMIHELLQNGLVELDKEKIKESLRGKNGAENVALKLKQLEEAGFHGFAQAVRLGWVTLR